MITPSIRLLPIVAVVAVAALGGRVYDIASGRSLQKDVLTGISGLKIPEAYAEAATENKAEPKTEPAADKNAKSEAGGQMASVPEGKKEAESAETASEGKNNDLWVDPEDRELNKTEVRLLQDLTARREALDKREKALMEREALLNAAETRVDQKVGELSSLRTEIQGLLKTYDQKQDEKMASLVKIYESMKPPDAARIFDNLDMDVLIQVVTRMKEAKTAPILAQMDANRAKELTLQLADRGKLPQNLTTP